MDTLGETTATFSATSDDNWSDSLANLELLLVQATNVLPHDDAETVAKSKSNPLLEQLLDKPINSTSTSNETNGAGSDKESEVAESSSDSESDDSDSGNITDTDESNDEQEQREQQPQEMQEEEECSEAVPIQKKQISLTEKMNGKALSKGVKKKKRNVIRNSLLRKNIKKIFTEKELDSETVNARKEEEERIKRLTERLQNRRQMQPQITITSAGYSEDVCIISSDEEGDTSNKRFKRSAEPEEIIDISDEDEDAKKCFGYSSFSGHSYRTSYTVTSLMDNEDDVQQVDGDESETTEEDMNNCGIHTNDDVNVPDELGRVLVNVGHVDTEPDIYLASHLSMQVKPHQIGGIRFLYDNIIVNQKDFDQSSGFGCILAHSMGLGKTLQLISFIDVFLTHTTAKRVLCIVPINTLQNWLAEFDLWLPKEKECNGEFNGEPNNGIKYRSFTLYELSDCKTTTSRAKEIISWYENGGVLFLGYEMYRILTSNQCSTKRKGKRKDEKEELDPDKYNQFISDMKNALIDPGPDLVVCDEGHRIKNCLAATSQALKNIRTKRRVVLTGYPLQNNLIEYWCMVDFVRPNYLGTKQEFCNMFERPIQNGQCADSTARDRNLMRYRAHVLHKLLRGFVQRRSHSILTKTLPRKHEHVILVRMTDVQRRLILGFLDTVKRDPLNNNALKMNPIQLFAVCCKIWNHPDILYQVIDEGKLFDDLDIDLPNKNRKTKKSNRKEVSAFPIDTDISNMMTPLGNYPSTSESNSSQKSIDYEWAKAYLHNYTPGIIGNGLKMVLLFEIISQSLAMGDRILVFSQSLFTLDIIERFLERSEVPLTNGRKETWCRNANYYRLDGSTSAQDREKLINNFNKNENIYLFLLSTRAGCLGINLVGANRIVVFDASWNPCHDAQAACRIYRYGQQKESYIYRLICDNSLEKKVYDRQVSKQGMSHRVVDELNPEATFTSKEINSLIEDLDQINEPPVRQFDASLYSDEIIRHMCEKLYHCITRQPFEHESLLLDHKESKLSKREKRIAEEDYMTAKKERVIANHGISTGTNYARGYAVSAGRGGIYPRTNLSHSYIHTPQYSRYNNSVYGSVLPSQSTPLPSNMYSNMLYNCSQELSGESLNEGHLFRRIIVENDVTFSVDKTNQQPPITVLKGQEISIMKYSNGMFLKTPEGRIVSLELNQSEISAIFGQKHRNTCESLLRGNQSSTVTLTCPSTSTSTPEVIDLSDDDDNSANLT